MSEDDRRRTVRAQLTNGAREARAYAEVSVKDRGDAHKTLDMRKVAVDPRLDPRMRKTVARGAGEAVHELEGDIVDPETGRVLPAPGADPNPNSPWRIGKHPTKVKLAAPEVRTAATAGVARSAASEPSRLAWVIAGAIVIAGVVIAVVVAGRTRREPAPRPTNTAAAPVAPRPVEERAAPSAAVPTPSPSVPTDAPDGPASAVAPGPRAPSRPATAAPPAAPPPATGSARGGRIF